MNRQELEPDKVFQRINDRWPSVGDKLFVPGRDAFVAESAAERDFRLLRGYKRAGDILLKEALSQRYDRDSLIFPAIFNYRHYVELALKTIIFQHGHVACCKVEPTHGLSHLWQVFKKISMHFDNDCLDDTYVAVEACINELEAVDAGSTAFRYSRDRAGTSPPFPFFGLDLLHLHDVMNGIENFFECSDDAFTYR